MKSFRKNVFRLNRYIRIPWRMMAATVALMIVNSALAGISITAIGPILDVVFNHGTLHLPASLPAGLRPALEHLAGIVNRMPPLLLLSRILAILTAAFLVKAVIGYFQQYLNGKFALKIVAQLRREVFGRYLNSPLELNQRKRLGERLSHFTYDIYLLQTAFGTNLPKLVFNFILTAAYFFVILFINWRLTLLSLLILPAFAWPTLRFGQRIRKLSRDSQESLANLNSLIQESLTNLPVVKAFNAQPRVEARFERENFRFYRVSLKSARRLAALTQITELVSMLAGAALIYFGAREVAAGTMSTGLFMAFLAGLLAMFAPLKTAINTLASLQQASAVFPRLFAVLEEKVEEESGSETAAGLESELDFESVSFAFGKKPVLDRLSFRLKKGMRLGLVGESGVGKTTLINLLLRFYRPQSGEIRLDGRPVTEFTLSSYRRLFGLVTQEPLLFNDTVAANIAYGRPEAGPDEIRAAARTANLDGVISELPEGYQTVIGERGATLSGGEKQRLALARALLAGSPVLVLDEATSNLDSESERLVQAALEKVMAGRTCLIIAHRLATLQKSDWIIVMEKGRIAEEGTHAQLMERRGRYYYLYTLQQQKN